MAYSSKQEYKARRQSKNVADGKTTNTRKGNYGKKSGNYGSKSKGNYGGKMGKSMGTMKYKKGYKK